MGDGEIWCKYRLELDHWASETKEISVDTCIGMGDEVVEVCSNTGPEVGGGDGGGGCETERRGGDGEIGVGFNDEGGHDAKG